MSTNKIIAELNAEQMQKEVAEFSPGDTIVVQVKVVEGDRERLQAFEGVVIGKRNRGLNSAFTVRATTKINISYIELLLQRDGSAFRKLGCLAGIFDDACQSAFYCDD